MGTLHLRSELAICANNCLSSEPVLPQADLEQRGCCVEDRPLVGRVHDRNEPHFGAPKYQRLKIRCARIVPTLSIKGERTTGRHYIMTPSASEGWA